jgi:hypothetical protein
MCGVWTLVLVNPREGLAVVDAELEPQAPRIVATMAMAAQATILLRRYMSPPSLRPYVNGASGSQPNGSDEGRARGHLCLLIHPRTRQNGSLCWAPAAANLKAF